MKTILLIGLGRFGRHCARKLNELGHQVMAVDVREDRVDAVLPYVTDGLIGNSTRADFMKTLGVRNYDVCIVAIGDDFHEVIYPERQLAEWTAIRYSSNHILDYTPLSEEYAVYEISIPDNWIGKSLVSLDLRRRHKINVFAIKQGELLITDINPDAPLRSNQTLMVIGKNKDIDKCFH